ncbi:MAG: hypothetical protein WC022_00380 [Parcubacteria group bacterium]
MNWFAIATIAYFLIALQTLLDKFILSSKRVAHPVVYAFYSGVMSFFTLVLFPFGFHSIGATLFLEYILAGAVFIFGMLLLFFAIQKSEASRVVPVVGAIIPIATHFFSMIFLGDVLSGAKLWGALVLILGGLLISWTRSERSGAKHSFFKGFYQSILSGIVLAAAFTSFKLFYVQDNFMDVFIWTRIGLFFGALTFLLYVPWRKAIFSSLSKFKKPNHTQQSSGTLFVFNKILGGVGSVMLNFSMSLGNITVINALVALEYTFIFILGVGLTFWLPKVFQEKMDWKNSAQKIFAILIISLGVYLVSVV